jgi:hypothetical protein
MNIDLEDGKPPVTFSLKSEDAQRFMAFMDTCNGYKLALDAGMESRTVYRAPEGMRMVPEGDVAELARLRLQEARESRLQNAQQAQENFGATLQQFVSAVNTAAAAAPVIPATWADAERLVGFASVDEALTAFAHDSTGDNATAIVLAVLESMADMSTPAAQQAHQRLGFGDVPLLVAELAMFIRMIASKVRGGRDATEVIGKALECQRQHGLGSPLRGEQAAIPVGVKTGSEGAKP